ncbi:FtsW/RodA/SpoVE family cell cycle protein [Parabacteroides bouchesdurhonensis]|uniref:FtsW/RodA/SpoVE family cell cycle protein n=1 Tax=Parabacteroides bouchesdurhonensis TaxID=1936995 RepID=UPI000E54FC0E|nr:FtsW/RodA/SpoVE family cell cycle protein [Parabacteroides bouchesdurhonensis]RHJ90861.1 FtsW/RodA/SpoVE family cell cycle protein [Bacteroides sp. AM07-16]
MKLVNKLLKGDMVIWIIFMFLCVISLVEVFSATSTLAYKQASPWIPIRRHAMILACGACLIVFLHHVPYKKIAGFLVLLFPVSIVLLVLTPILGEEINGAGRWLWGIQPSELAKLSSIGYMAYWLSKKGTIPSDKIFWWILGGVGLACVFIFPENFSTAAMLFGFCYLMMFIGQIALKKLLLLAGIVVLFAGTILAVLFITPDDVLHKYLDRGLTWKNRIVEHLHGEDKIDPDTYVINDKNYQVSHAKIAIARGGVFGNMPGHGQQRDFLPQAYSDFIYAIIIEEMGYAGGIFVLMLYIMLLVRVGIIARKCDKIYAKYLVIGCGLLMGIQALANMAVAVNLIPVTGQPLPLVSRGGTSTMISCIYFGIILSVSRFGAHMGDEEEDGLEEEDMDTSELSQTEIIAEESPVEAVQENVELITETKE